MLLTASPERPLPVIRRQALVLTLTSMLLVGGGTALAAPPAPTPSQLRDAQQHVRLAQQSLNARQVEAERAAEAYNGASLRATQAAARSAVAAAAAKAASSRAEQARTASAAAAGRAQGAVQASMIATDNRVRAEQSVAAAQGRLDGLAAGAYRSGGPMAVYSALLVADPVAVANGQDLINRIDRQQKTALVAFDAAKTIAADASARAAQAELAATDRARQVAQLAEQADVDAAQARATAVVATSALRDSVRAALVAVTARTHAQSLVALAQRQLGVASATSASLAAKAEQARREAAAIRQRMELAAAAAREASSSQPAGGGPSISAAGADAAAVAVAWAYREIGVPYSWGGGDANGPTLGFAQGAFTVGFDCSGLTAFAWAHAGVQLGHYTGSQWDAGRHVAREDLQPGDLVFFATDTADPATIHHVGLYVGDGNMVNAPHTGDVVRVGAISDFDGYIGAVRLVG